MITWELESMNINQNWDIFELPEHTNTVSSKFFFYIKKNADESIGKYEARLVTRGCFQVYTVD